MLSKGKVLFEKRGQAPSPSKDYHQLLVTEDLVIWRTWKISRRKDQIGSSPSQVKLTYDDFLYDSQVSPCIRIVFGEDVLLYAEGLVNGDWLIRMKDSILMNIFTYLDLSDIFRISSVCRRIHSICCSNMLWRKIYESHCSHVTPEIMKLGDETGWKRLFFTNKLQLRKEVSRLRRFVSEEKESNMPIFSQDTILYSSDNEY